MTANLKDLLDETLTELSLGLPDLCIEPHSGKFDLKELDRYAVGRPTLRVAVLAAPLQGGHHDVEMRAQLAAYLIVEPDQNFEAHERALTIASAVLALVGSRKGFGYHLASKPEDLRWTNLYSSASDRRGVHLSAITWFQQLNLTPTDAANAIPDLRLVCLDYDDAPRGDGEAVGDNLEATDKIDLEQAP